MSHQRRTRAAGHLGVRSGSSTRGHVFENPRTGERAVMLTDPACIRIALS